MNIQCWFPLGLTGLISSQSKGLSRVFSSTTIQNHQFFSTFSGPILTFYTTTGKLIAWTVSTFVSKVMSLLFNTLSGFVIAFLSRSKGLLISWVQSLSTVTFYVFYFLYHHKNCLGNFIICIHFLMKQIEIELFTRF